MLVPDDFNTGYTLRLQGKEPYRSSYFESLGYRVVKLDRTARWSNKEERTSKGLALPFTREGSRYVAHGCV